MAYEKKVEPLTKFDYFMAGITLILWVLILQIFPWANSSLECDEEVLKFNVSSEEDMITFHECIKEHKTMYLVASTCLLLGYPIVLAHIHYAHRVISTMWSCYDLDLFEIIYFGSWFISATLYCVVLPAIIILFVYYDWEFADGYQYTGYAIQFQFAHFAFILNDCIIIPLGLTAGAPWISCMYTILGLNNSSHWIVEDKNRATSIKRMFSCQSCGDCGTLLLLLVCLIMGCIPLFGACATTFEFKKSGFFSYHGDSQWLYTVMFFSWITFGISNLYMCCNFESIQAFMNNMVKPVDAIPLSEKQMDKKEFDTNPVVPVGPIEPVEPVVPASQEDVVDADL